MAKTVELKWIPADGSGLSRRAKQGGKYYAFVPDPLAGMSLKLPSELSRRIVRIEREIHNLGMRDNTHSLEGVARLLLRSEAVASSRIEGIAPNSDKVAMAILARESDSEIRGFKESATAVARNVAILDTINTDLAYKDELVLDDIVAMQTALVAEKPLQGVRTTQNWIGGSDYHPIDAAFVPRLLHKSQDSSTISLNTSTGQTTRRSFKQRSFMHSSRPSTHSRMGMDAWGEP